MPDVLTNALATPGLIWIALAALVAGTVRGFAGFGTAMIYLPVAGQFLDPVSALTTLVVMDCLGPLPAIPRAARDADWSDLRRLTLAMILCLPLGVWLLLSVPAEVFRYSVSAVALVMLAILILGIRYTGRLSPPAVYGVGGAGGVLGGAVGIPGPPVILFYMASPHPPSVIRATNMLYLFFFDLAFVALLGIQGLLTLEPIIIGLVLCVPIVVGTLIGSALFRPGQERTYRAVAYVIIFISAVKGLPIWS